MELLEASDWIICGERKVAAFSAKKSQAAAHFSTSDSLAVIVLPTSVVIIFANSVCLRRRRDASAFIRKARSPMGTFRHLEKADSAAARICSICCGGCSG